jgi:transposase-like protein
MAQARYTPAERRDALRQIEAAGGDLAAVSASTGIPLATLRRWHDEYEAGRPARIRAELRRLEERLIENTRRLVESLEAVIDDAPLGQRATAAGALLDRFLKIEAYLADAQHGAARDPVIRIEYRHPDGSIQVAPPWADDPAQFNRLFAPARSLPRLDDPIAVLTGEPTRINGFAPYPDDDLDEHVHPDD